MSYFIWSRQIIFYGKYFEFTITAFGWKHILSEISGSNLDMDYRVGVYHDGTGNMQCDYDKNCQKIISIIL